MRTLVVIVVVIAIGVYLWRARIKAGVSGPVEMSLWRRTLVLVIAAVCVLAAMAGYREHQRRSVAQRNRDCARKVRALAPHAYDDMDDQTLGAKALSKYPNCELPQLPQPLK